MWPSCSPWLSGHGASSFFAEVGLAPGEAALFPPFQGDGRFSRSYPLWASQWSWSPPGGGGELVAGTRNQSCVFRRARLIAVTGAALTALALRQSSAWRGRHQWHGRRHRPQVHGRLPGRDPNSSGEPSAAPALTATGVSYDSSLSVTYWQTDARTALS